jgi:serine/threonine protein phosphatase 1
MIVAIGDLHGHCNEFGELMYNLNQYAHIDLKRDQIIFLGDYIDGGPDSACCVDVVRDLQEEYGAIVLRGNHEQMLLDSYDDPTNWNKWATWYYQGGEATVASYMPPALSDYEKAIFPRNARAVPEDVINWMRTLPYYHETNSFYFVHAGFNPGIKPENNSTETMMWIRQPFIESDYIWPKRVVFGHTYIGDRPLVMDNKIGIDTMLHNSGRLTAAVLIDGRLKDSNGDIISFYQTRKVYGEGIFSRTD